MHTSLLLLGHVLAAAPAKKSSKSSSFVPILVLFAIGAVVYVSFLRPARKRQMAAVVAKREVQIGDEITTTSGLIATVIAKDEDMLTLEVAPGVHCRYVPAAVLRVNGDELDADELDTSTHEVIDDPEQATAYDGGPGAAQVDDQLAAAEPTETETETEHPRDAEHGHALGDGHTDDADDTETHDPTDLPDETAPA